MVLDLIVQHSDDGYSTEIPSIKGCESWAHNEDEAITKTLELFRFYIQVDMNFKIKVDLARKEGLRKVYKIIFDK
ncbi:MAG: hypothetical protein KGZ42_10350 [Melioribacter sp.]|nr:hypothetical protein [Melioribacter sp.]